MLRNQIEAIQQEIQDAMKRYERTVNTTSLTSSSHHQQGNVGTSSSQPNPENYVHLDGEIVVGIDDVVDKLLENLTNNEDGFKVVGIVGTGGGGKTTLATQLYRHSNVDHKAFVSISQQWNTDDLLARIFKQVKGEGCNVPPSDEIVKQLHNFLKDKQCLIVLDDIWKKEDWDAICPIFPRANKGCKVILTTRIEEVVLHADNNCLIHEPKLLTEGQKWELFSKVALEGRPQIENDIGFKNLGKEMLGKCEGVPLAVVALAGILRTKKELYQWEEISRDWAAYILKVKGSHKYGVVEDMLELSYLHLPTHLKQCFLYLSCFPEDYTIRTKVVTRMWIAEGFITNGVKAEDVGIQFLDELAQRCVLQVTERNCLGHILGFRLHDLMRELCIKKADEIQFFQTIASTRDSNNVQGSNLPNARRISLPSRDVDINNPQLRTLARFGGDSEFVLNMLVSIPEKFTLLRVLHIENVGNDILPNQIGDLTLLKYLAIIKTKIGELPTSITKLENLLYLEYVQCGEPRKVPKGLACQMKNLRLLSLPREMNGDSSLGLSGAEKLHTLEGGAGKWMAKDLPASSRTLQKLCIIGIQEMEEIEAIYGCPSIVDGCLASLICVGLGEHMEFDLKKLSQCTSLWELCLMIRLVPDCTEKVSYFPPNLVEMVLVDTSIEREDLLEVIGELPKLRSLSLFKDAYLGTQLSCTSKGGTAAFPQLQKLELVNLPMLEEWILEEGSMPCLRKLRIGECVKLKGLPESIRSIATLKELNIEYMPEEFCRRLGYGEPSSSSSSSSSFGQDSHIVQHIPTLTFTKVRGS